MTVKLNFAYKVDDNKWSRDFISDQFQIKPNFKNKVSLLFNLFSGNVSMLFMHKYITLVSKEDKEKVVSFFPQLDLEIKKIDTVIKEFISLSDEDKRTVHALLQTQQQWKKILLIEIKKN